MQPHRNPGNEPDSTDMAEEPCLIGRTSAPKTSEVEPSEEEAAKLGDFA